MALLSRLPYPFTVFSLNATQIKPLDYQVPYSNLWETGAKKAMTREIKRTKCEKKTPCSILPPQVVVQSGQREGISPNKKRARKSVPSFSLLLATEREDRRPSLNSEKVACEVSSSGEFSKKGNSFHFVTFKFHGSIPVIQQFISTTPSAPYLFYI